MMRLPFAAILTIMIFIAATGAWAQESPQVTLLPPAPQLLPAPNPQPPLPDNPLRIISRYFQLKPEQVDGVVRLLDARKSVIEPLLQEIASAEKGLRDLIAKGMDPLALGNAVIALEDLRKKVQEANRQFMADFRQLLTPDQKSQLQLLERATRLQTVVNAAHALGVL